ncbi:restriction endonuclease subunit S [Microbacterium paraoxydans]|uniref:restriction endonuclease subunit S n=1 Tax=Microbacterium paraoxydans TaxID=199592 RepID=UPI001E38AE0E|nr:restriction endonuclease subunit S [Microbacterium paraoxydans]
MNGGTPPPDALNWGGEIPWATPVDLNTADGSVLHSTLRTITAQGLASGSSLVPVGSVILSTRAPIGYSVLSGSPVAFNQGCKALIPTLAVDPHFLLLVMQAAKSELSRRGQGTTFLELSSMALGSVEIPLVPVSEQREIVSYLIRETAEIDAFIADQEELIALLTERRAATITHAVTKGVDPDAPMNDSGVEWLGDVPQDWAVAPLKWRARLVTGGTPKAANDFSEVSGLPWFRPEDLDVSGRNSVASRSISTVGEKELRSFPASSTLICTIGATLGKAGAIGSEGYSNQQITAVIPRTDNPRFIYYTMVAARTEIVRLSVGNTLPIINNDRMGVLRIPIPPSDYQHRIADYLDHETAELDATIADASEAIALSKERRAALISAAVTGKIDARGLV